MLISKDIKNIIFDFGGVILNIDMNRTTEAFKELKFTDFENASKKFRETRLFSRYEIGTVSDEDFRNEIISQFKNPVSFEVFDQAWNLTLLDFPKKNIDILKELSKTHRLFLLSNTNKIHYDSYIETFRNQFGFELRSLFEKSYFSHEIGMRKPNPEIFLKVLSENQLLPEETLFVDDFAENRKAAAELGIQITEISTNQGLASVD
jgi:putative hydrolase of the HAD superfamily